MKEEPGKGEVLGEVDNLHPRDQMMLMAFPPIQLETHPVKFIDLVLTGIDGYSLQHEIATMHGWLLWIWFFWLQALQFYLLGYCLLCHCVGFLILMLFLLLGGCCFYSILFHLFICFFM
ncbi:uncharacterized protein LOC130778545 isoform X2 [Actinidia eriantha]|uniref:uncharacterized protein LOC130778545 isoform X2 n=1 Tax=Actinidia eriantha TaxID=165200 RepID=UPI0025888D93|nr:uncharacterized protein LOC130778545 isoform X2 [Actinidia eriantha]